MFKLEIVDPVLFEQVIPHSGKILLLENIDAITLVEGISECWKPDISLSTSALFWRRDAEDSEKQGYVEMDAHTLLSHWSEDDCPFEDAGPRQFGELYGIGADLWYSARHAPFNDMNNALAWAYSLPGAKLETERLLEHYVTEIGCRIVEVETT